jgi:hypothetical protein
MAHSRTGLIWRACTALPVTTAVKQLERAPSSGAAGQALNALGITLDSG